MDQNAHLRQRTDQILRERIALGMTGGEGRRKKRGGANPKRCAKGSHKKCVVGRGEGVMAGKVSRKKHIFGRGEGVLIGGCMECGHSCEHCGSGEGIYGESRMVGGRIRKSKVMKASGVAKRKRSGSKTLKGKSGKRSTNPWVSFLKKMVKETGIPYNELLRDPEVKRIYHGM